jgi:hypothetical protein
MLLRSRPPEGFIEPCLPSSAERPPIGPGWIHEIKLDGFRLKVRRDMSGVRLLDPTREMSGRFATMPGPDLLYFTMLGLGEKPLKRREFITREAASNVAFAFGAKRGSNARQAFDHRCFHRDPHASHHAVRPS